MLREVRCRSWTEIRVALLLLKKADQKAGVGCVVRRLHCCMGCRNSTVEHWFATQLPANASGKAAEDGPRA